MKDRIREVVPFSHKDPFADGEELTADQVPARIREQILREEIARLEAENARLRATQASPTPQPAPMHETREQIRADLRQSIREVLEVEPRLLETIQNQRADRLLEEGREAMRKVGMQPLQPVKVELTEEERELRRKWGLPLK